MISLVMMMMMTIMMMMMIMTMVYQLNFFPFLSPEPPTFHCPLAGSNFSKGECKRQECFLLPL